MLSVASGALPNARVAFYILNCGGLRSTAFYNPERRRLHGAIDTGSPLGTFNHANFSDRIKASTSAKLALVEKMKARPGPDDPRRQAVAAERKAIHEARLARQADRQRLLQEQREREAEEQRKREEIELAAALEREAALEVERQAAEAARRERASRVVTDLAAQKALRDARYAARKARQKAR